MTQVSPVVWRLDPTELVTWMVGFIMRRGFAPPAVRSALQVRRHLSHQLSLEPAQIFLELLKAPQQLGIRQVGCPDVAAFLLGSGIGDAADRLQSRGSDTGSP
ncbi:hypothetical protein JKG68_14690 [Microvirga aerilata]|uniref:Uncharacterized protein n=1 Tax=Microvirga aerilata TaxID=670292 RepID=A0A936Z9B0_9HYPH|nr:hypothetical protein [Microvirga aerilata]MBL0405217.1 hypothetical protein [Microvirga aerilata]